MWFIPLVRLPRTGRKTWSCAGCDTLFAHMEDLVAVMDRPTKAVYYDPAGAPCEVLTFLETLNLEGADFSTDEYSWFDGYSWRPVGCARCGSFVGWRYEAMEPHLDPQAFFGLLTENIREKVEE